MNKENKNKINLNGEEIKVQLSLDESLSIENETKNLSEEERKEYFEKVKREIKERELFKCINDLRKELKDVKGLIYAIHKKLK